MYDNSLVVWNPGPRVEKRFQGFMPGDEKTMLCLEAANPAGADIILKPDGSHKLTTVIFPG